MLQCAWCKYIYIYIYMVGGFNHFEKYEFVNGEDDIPYMKWNIYIYIHISPVELSGCRRPKKAPAVVMGATQ